MSVENTKPTMNEVSRTEAVTYGSDITYNDSSTTYSSSSQVYGGIDPKQSIGPNMTVINLLIPSQKNIGELPW